MHNLMLVPMEPMKPTDRASLIEWLMWNDPNGCYSDEDNELEFGRIATTEELQQIYNNQLEG